MSDHLDIVNDHVEGTADAPGGRTIVVTGAASGIGAALVRRLLDADPQTTVIALDLRESTDPRARSVHCDLSDPRSIDAVALPDHIDALANVAGVPGTASASVVLAVNTFGVRALTLRVLERMTTGAVVVNVASLAAHRNTQPPERITELLAAESRADIDRWVAQTGVDGSAAYDTSKRALVDWTVALSAALQPRGIRAASVSPGPTETPILGDFEQTMGVEAISRSAGAVGRHGTAAETAAAIDFLLSPDASWVNGIDIPVDGGLSAIRAATVENPLRPVATDSRSSSPV
ncbi:SDR family oxidoreductase [Gordonia oryzae]|uniref:SDR family oxidoreductase n=1 Tax=Gordonia oryzae TaxID=2487349 RepID=A0A3N4GP61_9ACTN|nr:SDR family oxidoreductase [Gordonia oryzae]RPA64693.1 SDR family oxidoreductase [Gordonia oryzae]